MNNSVAIGLGASREISWFVKLRGFATTLANSIASVAAEVMVAIFSGENFAGVVVFLPGSHTLSAKLGAVVRAARVDCVHVVH